MRVVVVGAGLGGLSAACHLAGRGHEVAVVERADVPGGRAGVWETAARPGNGRDAPGRRGANGGGYHFDTGPSVLTMTGILAETFAAAGADLADHLKLLPVDPMYRATFPGAEDVLVR